MHGRLNETESPVSVLIRDRLPDYIPWFLDWKKKRDQVKNGVNFFITGPQDDPGVGFCHFESRTGDWVADPSQTDRASHVAEAIEWSAGLDAVIVEDVPFLPPPGTPAWPIG